MRSAAEKVRVTTHTPEELGCLAGGPGRAAEVALARLLQAGLVRISRDGVVTAVHQNPGRVTPLEAHVLQGLRGRRYLDEVLRDAAVSAEAEGLRSHLAGRGLLRRRRSLRPRLYPWLFTLGIGLVLFGFVDLVFPDITESLADFVPRLAEIPRWVFFAAGVLVIVWASVYLRQRGSQESKPVAEPHHETGA